MTPDLCAAVVTGSIIRNRDILNKIVGIHQLYLPSMKHNFAYSINLRFAANWRTSLCTRSPAFAMMSADTRPAITTLAIISPVPSQFAIGAHPLFSVPLHTLQCLGKIELTEHT